LSAKLIVMQNHTKVYIEYFSYGEDEFVPCECCGSRAVDIHHIVARGMGGVSDNRLDVIENLMAVCRECHIKCGDKPNWLSFLVTQHAKKMKGKFETVWNTIQKL